MLLHHQPSSQRLQLVGLIFISTNGRLYHLLLRNAVYELVYLWLSNIALHCLYHHPPPLTPAQLSDAQLLDHRSLSLSLVVNFMPLIKVFEFQDEICVIGSVVYPLYPDIVS